MFVLICSNYRKLQPEAEESCRGEEGGGGGDEDECFRKKMFHGLELNQRENVQKQENTEKQFPFSHLMRIK